MKISTLVLCVLIGTALAEFVRTPASLTVEPAAILGGNETGT